MCQLAGCSINFGGDFGCLGLGGCGRWQGDWGWRAMHYGRGLISDFQEFFASGSKIFILAYHSMGFRHCPDIS